MGAIRNAWGRYVDVSETAGNWIGETRIGRFAARPLIGLMLWAVDTPSDNLRAVSYDAHSHRVDMYTPDETTAFKHGKQTLGTRLIPGIIGLGLAMMLFLVGSAFTAAFNAGYLVLVLGLILLYVGTMAAMNVDVAINGEEVSDDGD